MPNRIFVFGVIVLGFALLTAIGVEPDRTDPGRGASRFVGAPVAGVQSAEAAMASRVSWHFVDVPLHDVIHELRQGLHINVRLDSAALAEEGIATDFPMTVHFDNVLLEVALQYSLQPLALTAFVDRNILVVTTVAKAQEYLVTRVYPVYDLVVFQTPDGERMEDYESLIRVLEEQTSGPWQEYAGEGGTVTELPNAGALVIRQSWKVHREVAGLLTALRKAKHIQQLPDIPVVIPDNGQPEYRGTDYFSADDEVDETSEGRTLDDTVSSRVSAPLSVPRWQIPRIDRSE